MRKILIVVALALVCTATTVFAQAQTAAATPPATSGQVSEENLKKVIQAAQEAHENQEGDDEITQWRTAFVMALQLHAVEAIYVSSLGLEQAFKDSTRPMERLAALRSGVNELKKQGGAGPIWGAQLEVALAIALEEQGKRMEAGAAAKRAVAVLETALGPKARDYRETLRTLATLFEEGGNSAAASEFIRRIDEIDRARDSEPVFGFKVDPGLRQVQDQLRLALETSSNVQIQLALNQISTSSEKLDMKNPFRAKALSDAASAVLKTTDPSKKVDVNVRPVGLAESILRKALDVRERAMGPNALADTSRLSLELYHLREYQSEVDTLSNHFAAIGETKRQEELLIRALETSERILGKQHPALAGPLRHLGDLYVGTGNKDRVKKAASEGGAEDGALDKAVELAKRELAIYEKTFGPEDSLLAGSLTRLGELLWLKGDEAAAKACDERSAKLQEVDSEGKTPEQTMLHEVKQHRAFLRFEEAEDQYETFRKLHPDKSS